MNEPFVSIVTPVYNGARFLDKCIQGVLEQSHKNFEYIIVDNASTDATPEIIDKYAKLDNRIRVFRNSSTLKVIDNFNECLNHVSRDAIWIKYALADDYLFPNCVELMLNVGNKDSCIGFVSAYHLNGKILANDGLPFGQEIADGKQMLKQHILRKLYVCLDSPNTLMYKKSVMDAMKGFDNRFLHADSELALRILQKHNLGFVHQVLSWTGINEARGTNYSFFHGIFTREYLRFAYKNIPNFKSISFTDAELQEVSDVYADEILRYISTHIVYFPLNDISNLLKEAPWSVKKRLLIVLVKKMPVYVKKFLGSVIHYNARIRFKPTFKR